MKKFNIFSFFIIVCALMYTQPCLSFSQKIDTQLETTVQKLRDDYQLPGVVIGVWIPNKGAWVKAFGFADKALKEKMTIDDHFRIGSVTKTFVVTGLLQLVDKGKLSLDDKINKYIENVPNGNKITLRQLANMTSGLPSYTKNKTWLDEFLKDKNRMWKPEELLNAAFSVPLSFNPGEKFEYSNTNTFLLGLVVEKVSGLKLEEYLKENIFKPLQLKNTSLPMDEKLPKPFAHGYAQLPDGSEEDDTFRNTSWAFAAGGMVSNLHDLKIWAQALGTGELLSKKSFKERLEWADVSPNTALRHYGLGIGFDDGWLFHTGELPGYNSVVAYLPEEKAIFVCLINSDATIKKSDISLKIRPEESSFTLIYKDELTPVELIYKSVFKILFPKNIPE